MGKQFGIPGNAGPVLLARVRAFVLMALVDADRSFMDVLVALEKAVTSLPLESAAAFAKQAFGARIAFVVTAAPSPAPTVVGWVPAARLRLGPLLHLNHPR